MGDFASAMKDTPSRGVSVELEQILILEMKTKEVEKKEGGVPLQQSVPQRISTWSAYQTWMEIWVADVAEI